MRMYKTIVAVVAFLVIALIVQLYEQDQTQERIAREQQAAIRMQSEKAAKAEETERARQAEAGISSKQDSSSDSLVPELFSVPNGTPKEFDITVDMSRMADVTVSGHFAVSGDRNKAIEVYIFDEDDYANWLYGNNSIALFSSGREAVGDIRARILKSGRYFLIFRNDASPTAINVTANITIQYEQIRTPS
jgi:hypothetical protein